MEKANKLTVVYDLETLFNYFCYSDVEIQTGKRHTFEIYDDSVNEFKEMMQHLRILKCQIGYNNVNFDYPILHYFFEHEKMLEKMPTQQLVTRIYEFTQHHIEQLNNRKEGLFNVIIPEWKMKIPQIDLYRIYHFDNMAKKTSLKDLEIAMNYPTVQDMPYAFNMPISRTEAIEIRDYNVNDILATFEFYKKSQTEIKLRLDLSAEYGLNLLNANDPKLGSEIFCKIISEAKGISMKELKQMRTERVGINLRDCILPYVHFQHDEFEQLLRTLRATRIKQTKNAFVLSVKYKGFTYDYGTGGIHGCIAPGRYKAGEGQRIKDIDVSSFYPNLAIINGFYPEHLGLEFCKIYKEVYEKRMQIPKKDPRNTALKLALNGVYGKSNDKYSFFYDPLYTMKITINGQLLLSMLCEKLQDLGCEVLQANTDGVTVRYTVDLEDSITNLCKEWMTLTKLDLEYAHYKEMIIRDVNNYIGIYEEEGKDPKYKGAFEIKKAWHKDTSFTIVPTAISEYFTKGIPIEQTIKGCKDIFMFTGRHKTNKECYSETTDIYTGKREKQQKTTRYYVSRNSNQVYYRRYVKGKSVGTKEAINSGYFVQVYNVHEEKPIEEYNINYQFYIDECNKIIEVIEPRILKDHFRQGELQF